MSQVEINSLKSRILSMAQAIYAAPSAYNARILNRACAELRAATGEVFSCGAFVKV